jgi:GDP-mannose 6-dehydrogenase
MAEVCRAGRLRVTTDSAQAVTESEISFICVGTASLRNGEHDLCHIERAAADIGDALRRKTEFHAVVLRSTVMPGTTESLLIPALERASGKRSAVDFGVCFNPEFLREGSGVADFLELTITVLGALDDSHLRSLRDVYAWVPGRLFETSLAAAETVKSICNVFHALKITFASEIGTLCKLKGVDEAVFEIFKAYTRLNASAAYSSPGFAFGGSCLPKDLRALLHGARQFNLRMPVVESIMPSNNDHIERAVNEVLETGKKKGVCLPRLIEWAQRGYDIGCVTA